MQGMRVRSLVGELRFHMPRSQKNQNIKHNRSNIVTNSIKTLKMVHIQKKKKKKGKGILTMKGQKRGCTLSQCRPSAGQEPEMGSGYHQRDIVLLSWSGFEFGKLLSYLECVR